MTSVSGLLYALSFQPSGAPAKKYAGMEITLSYREVIILSLCNTFQINFGVFNGFLKGVEMFTEPENYKAAK